MTYECGKLGEEECYQLLEDQYGLQEGGLATAIRKGREASDYDHDLVASLWAFKKSTPGVRFIMASNISLPDYTALQERWGHPFWSLFDYSFPSCKVGVRKPSPRFYRHLLRNTGASPHHTVFVDDRPENVLAAAALGMRGVLFEAADALSRSLRSLVGDSVERGRAYLTSNAGQHFSTIDGEVVLENYSQLLILDTTSDSYVHSPTALYMQKRTLPMLILPVRTLVELKRPQRFWNFFSGSLPHLSQQIMSS